MKRRVIRSGSDEESGSEDRPPRRNVEQEEEEPMPTRRSTRPRASKFKDSQPKKSYKELLDEIEEEDEADAAIWKEETEEDRQRRINFVVDDDGTGYVDDDLEHDGREYAQEDDSGDDDQAMDDASGKRKKKKSKKLGDVNARAELQKTTIRDMFAKAERKKKPTEEETRPAVEIKAEDIDIAVDDSLADLLVSSSTSKQQKKRAIASHAASSTKASSKPYKPVVHPARTAPVSKPSAAPVSPSYAPPAQPLSRRAVKAEDEPPASEAFDYEDTGFDAPSDYPSEMPATTEAEAKAAEDAPVSQPTKDTESVATPAAVPSAQSAAAARRSRLLALASAAPLPSDPEPQPPAEPVASATPAPTTTSGSAPIVAESNLPMMSALPFADATPSMASGGPGQQYPSTSVPDKPGKEMIEIYWMDMWEDRGCPGEVYVFGRTSNGDSSSASAMVVLQNVQRNLLVLPRGDAASDEEGRKAVQEEALAAVRARLDPAKQDHVRFRSKWVTRSYAFELPDIPRGSADYLLIQYSMGLEMRNTPSEPFPVGRTYAHVFGANQTAIERLLMANKLMGPCWLQIESSKIQKDKIGRSHGRFEAAVDLEVPGSTLTIVQKAPPRVSVLSLALKTIVDPMSHQHQIVAATGVLHPDVPLDASKPPTSKEAVIAFQLVRPVNSDTLPPGFSQQNPNVLSQPNERALLNCLLAKLQVIDPDFLMGHNIEGFELDLLLTRMKQFKVQQWSKLGRLHLREPPRSKKVAGGRSTHYGVLTPGRLLLDTYKSAQEFVLNQREYSLSSLCDSLGLTPAGRRRAEIDPSTVPEYFRSRDQLSNLLRHNVETAQLALELAFKLEAFSLTFELTSIAGNLWRKTLSAGRAERIEYLLLHAFHNLDYIVPDKEDFASSEKKRKNQTSKKAAYSGGLVLDPKAGLYDSFVVLLDFNALYPSIIQEYNICFTTVKRPAVKDDDSDPKKRTRGLDHDGGDDDHNDESMEAENENEDMDVAEEMDAEEVPLPEDDGRGPNGLAILPRVIKNIVDRRVAVKNQLSSESDPMKRRQLDTRQKALKITANSMYGCLGFSSSRFFARPLASLITSRGRLILQDTVETTKQLGYDVVYGDTDSIMIDTRMRGENSPLTPKDLEPVSKIAEEIQKAVNPKYKYLKIALDGVFATLLLLKKKKYAALSVHVNQGRVTLKRETKGLDLVRRDWCLASRDVGSQVLDLILSGKSKEDVIEGIRNTLVQFKDDARAAKIGLDRWCVTKGLNKSPRDYPDAKGQPHLQVALAMMNRGKVVNTGDHIPYVICTKTRAELKAGTGAEGATEDPSAPVIASAAAAKPSSSFAERAFHPDEVREFGLNVDIDWYLGTQILPPVQRLCEGIEGLTSAELAEALGLDATKFKGHMTSHVNTTSSCFDEVFGNSFAADIERFKNCEKIQVECPTCSFQFEFPGVFWLPEEKKRVLDMSEPDASLVLLPGTCCPKGCEQPVLDSFVLQNLLVLSARKAIKKYHQGWLESDDPTASDLKTRQQGLRNVFPFHGKRVTLHRKYSAKDLWVQLLYLTSLVDWKRANSSLTRENEHRKKNGLPPLVVHGRAYEQNENFDMVKQYLEARFLHHSGFGWVTPDFFAKVFRIDPGMFAGVKGSSQVAA